MHGDVAQAFGLAHLGHSTGHYVGTPVEIDADRWEDDGACHPRHKPDDMTHAEWVARWFPEITEEYQPRNKRSIRHLYPGADDCDRCPVKDRCLDEHLHEVAGMWGGTTPNDRRALRVVAGNDPKADRRRRDPWATAETVRLARLGVVDTAIATRLHLSVNTVRDIRQAAGILRRSNFNRNAS